MKFFFLSIFLFGSLSCTSQTQTGVNTGPNEINSDKILIIYLTRTKNTKAVAEMIQKKVGGTLVSLELQTPYPENYKTIVAQVAEENETGFLPPLNTKIENLSQYDLIFVGFPTWGMQLPPPMKTFLSENDLSGKTVIPFNTNAGYGIGRSFDIVEELCPDSEILKGFSTKGGIDRDGVLFVMEGEKEVEVRQEVSDWLEEINILPAKAKSLSVDVDPNTPLLWVLRDHLNLVGTKFGCGIAQCGACTIHLDGDAIRSCSYPVSAIGEKKVVTIEGLSENGDHPVQKAWAEHDVPQCGYCQAGQIMTAVSLLAQNPNPTDEEISYAMNGNICRCGTYTRIKAAVKTASTSL